LICPQNFKIWEKQQIIMNKCIATVNNNFVSVDGTGIPKIASCDVVKSVVENLKAIYPDNKYIIYKLILKEVL
jgi:hypothetical protein